ncbi:MAG: LamB/YcsF family protein, partial [Eudoraea sp.]|nr:LamB/YcsF family protein [Eudoraea sp.]
MIIDINSDVGEGLGNEKDLFPYLSSCNIACGGHVGDASSIREIVLLSKTYQLKAGAHPSYPDPENFGRITMKYTKAHLIESIRNQLALISDILKEEGEELHHIKPHGALYNDVASDPEMAVTLLEAIAKFREDTILYVPYNSQIERLALEGGFMIWREAFGDRNYNDDLSL